jgi:hypothetical protein
MQFYRSLNAKPALVAGFTIFAEEEGLEPPSSALENRYFSKLNYPPEIRAFIDWGGGRTRTSICRLATHYFSKLNYPPENPMAVGIRLELISPA